MSAPSISSRRYTCQQCGRVFTKRGLAVHSHRCPGAPISQPAATFQCERCGRRFGTDLGMRRHHSRCNGGAQLTCPHCGHDYASRASCISHARQCSMNAEAHTTCEHCGCRILRASLKRHQAEACPVLVAQRMAERRAQEAAKKARMADPKRFIHLNPKYARTPEARARAQHRPTEEAA